MDNQPNLASAYKRTRAWGYKAAPALAEARKQFDRYKAARFDYESAGAVLADLRAKGAEDSAISAASARLDATRRACSDKRRLVAFSGPLYGRPYVGTWQPGKPGQFYCEKPESIFRAVRAVHDLGRYHAGKPDHGGWYTCPFGESFRDGSGLCWGVVAQMTGRDGKARFVAGWQFGGHDAGPTLDLGRIFEAQGDDSESAEAEAARHADKLAERAAESERNYQAAWQAGNRWADLGREIAEARAEVLAVLAERRKARALSGADLPALCGAIRARVSDMLAEIAKARAKRAELAEGDSGPYLHFWPGCPEMRAAFCDGAELDSFPA